MSRLLLSGSSRDTRELQNTLRQCGHDVTLIDAAVPLAGCDAVLHIGRPTCSGRCPVLLPGGESAPRILIGETPRDCPLRSLADVRVADGTEVPAVLDALAARAAGGPQDAPGWNTSSGRGALLPPGYADFVGHELRTPLTVLKTAMEAILELEADDEVACDGSGRDRREQLADLVRRNLLRLERSIVWSEGFLRAAVLPGDLSLAAPTLASFLRDSLEEEGDQLASVRVVLPDAPGAGWGVPAPVAGFIRQFVRACRYQASQGELTLIAEAEESPAGSRELRLRVDANPDPQTADAGPSDRGTIRTNLASLARVDGQDQFRLELAGVLRYSLPQSLVDHLGAVVRLGARDDDSTLVSARLIWREEAETVVAPPEATHDALLSKIL